MALIAFDVNETLVSLDPVRTLLVEVLGEPDPTGEWFARLLHASLVVDAAGRHEPFGVVAGRVLRRLASSRGRSASDHDLSRLADTMAHLPAHADVPEGLAKLADAGHRLVAFSNGAPDVLATQLTHAGIVEPFEEVVSVDDRGGGWFKPHRHAYEFLCRRLNAFADEVTMVAAHDWDVAGAQAAGLSGVLLARRPNAWHLPGAPHATVSRVSELVDLRVA